jgi:hypothetical protein
MGKLWVNICLIVDLMMGGWGGGVCLSATWVKKIIKM